MGLGDLLWTTLGKPIASYAYNQALDRSGIKIKDSVSNRKKKLFLSQMEQTVLEKFGNESFYNALSKCLLKKENQKLIVDWCEKLHGSPFDTLDELINALCSQIDTRNLDNKQVKPLLQIIINAIYWAINEPSSEEDRAIIRNVNSALDKQTATLITRMDNLATAGSVTATQYQNDMTAMANRLSAVESHCEAILLQNNAMMELMSAMAATIEKQNILLSNGKSYTIQNQRQHKSTSYKIELWVKCSGIIAEAPSIDAYFKELRFTGNSDVLDVVRYQVTDDFEKLIESYELSNYVGPIYKLPVFYAKERVVEYSDVPDTMIVNNTSGQYSLKIIPPMDEWIIDLENATQETLIENLHLGIKRKRMGPDAVEATLIDLRENVPVKVTIKNTFINSRLDKTTLTLSMRDSHDIYDRRAYFELMYKIMLSNKIVYRDPVTHEKKGEGSGFTGDYPIEAYSKSLELTNKLISIQDYFGVKFSYPDEIISDDIFWVDVLSRIIKTGYAIVRKFSVNFEPDKTNTIPLSPSENYLFACGFNYITLFDAHIDFGEQLRIIMPNVTIAEKDDGAYKITPLERQIIVFEPLWGEIDDRAIALELLEGSITEET